MIALLAAFGVTALLAPTIMKLVGRPGFLLLALIPAGALVWVLLQSPVVLAGGEVTEYTPWVPSLGLGISLRLDHLAWLLALFVTGIGALVLVYCWRYFRADDDRLGRFGALFVAFAGVMLGLVTADDVLLLVTFWESTSVLSYLLIGHNSGKREARGAALQAMLVTSLGGLAMLVGVILLAAVAGTTSLSGIVAAAPTGAAVETAIALVMVGIVSKSALVPFHFWLPAAMAAPTPVSAYLHAAAMVKAGVYLVARLAPGFDDLVGWQIVVVVLGGTTMVLGGLRALRQYDLKLLLAHGTVSQLGFLVMMTGLGGHDIALAAIAVLLSHAVFKATLFLVVGIVDHDAGGRDWRELSGIGRRRPVLFAISVIAAGSMAGIPPLLGFVSKEAALSTLLEAAVHGDGWAATALVFVIIGSVLTVGYAARFVWGAFGTKPDLEPTPLKPSDPRILIAPVALTVITLGLGPLADFLDGWLAPYPDEFGDGDYHLALWHGFEPALGISAGIIALGLTLFVLRTKVAKMQAAMPHMIAAPKIYWATVRFVDSVALRLTTAIQRGGLPGYLGTALVVLVLALGGSAAAGRLWPEAIVLWDSPVQVVLAVLMITAAISAARARQRLTAIVLVGVTGYGLVGIFAFQGAPDLALTQALIETITLVVAVLVLRRLPTDLNAHNRSSGLWWRLSIGIAVGVVMAGAGAIALAAREAPSIAVELPELSYEGAHAANIVNGMIVDIRAWDTLGEISVLVAVATGVASLLFITGRAGDVPRVDGAADRRRRRLFAKPLREDPRTGEISTMPAPAPERGAASERTTWLLAGRTLSPANRSIMLEVVVRLLFHPAIVVSVFLLFVGHSAPGGGFAGGLLAGLALVARYLAGGRYELGEAAPVDAGRLLGVGVILAAGTGISALVFGQQVLESTWWEFALPPFGTVSIGTSSLFDIGVYLVVIGVVLDILRSLGGEVDRQQEEADRGSEGVREVRR